MARTLPALGSIVLTTALVLVVVPVAARTEGRPPADVPGVQGWLDGPTFTGGWGGRRDALAETGIAPGARYTSGFWSNVDGGLQTGTEYEGFAEWWFDTDLEKLVGWKGGGYAMSWYSYHGGQPSADRVGTFPTQTVSGHETATSVRFYEILLRQSWGHDRFLLKVGQLAADQDFFISENAADLLNGTFGYLGIGRTSETVPFYPLAAPGVYFRARSEDARWEAHAGVYSADPGEDESSNFGFDWSFDGGATFLAELRTRRRPFGRPGTFTVGGTVTTAALDRFDTGTRVSGSYGIYLLADQLLVEATDSRPGLGVFLRSYGTPKPERSFIHWYVDAGFKLTRPLPSRDRDMLGFGFAYLHFSEEYVASARASGEDVSRRQAVLEATYRFQATGWLTLQPNVQYFIEPHFSRRDATVVGLRAVIEL